MLSRIALTALLCSPIACMAAEHDDLRAVGLADPTGGNAVLGLQRWRVLTQSDNYSFEDYAAFVATFPEWPEDTRMRRNAEKALNIESLNPRTTIAFFRRFEPLTPAGMAKYAVALQISGEREEAVQWAKNAWRRGTLTDRDELVLQVRFAGQLSAEDHDARMDSLLWARALRDAAEQLGNTSPARRAVFSARLAQLTESGDADAQAASVAQIAKGDAGYLADRARYLRNRGRSYESRQLLANRETLRGYPSDPDTWYDANLINAKAAANDRQWSVAYAIASNVDDAFPPDTRIADQVSGIRDKYSDLVWLAGTTALFELRRPADAIAMFDRYARSYDSPQITSKGYYWAGRAALEAGRDEEAETYFRKAAKFPAYFYGQLAYERLNEPLPAFDRAPRVELTEQDRAAFDQQPLVIAAKAAQRTSPWREQIRFWRALAYNAKDDRDYALLSDLAARIGARDLGVITGISSLSADQGITDATAFPTMPVPFGYEGDWTMIHAITRQESQFAEGAISHAGARGLMQLMPGTAREQAGKIGLSYDAGALTSDPSYNIKLGSRYFERMRDYYGGSYPLAVAAYNAGPGNVNKWLRANGDPRTGAVDWLRWIEDIPIFETRNYVKRVLENAVVYDSKNPQGRRIGGDTPLTTYIGKRYKG